MKSRAPTAEELRLWRESNRFTKKILAEVEAEHEEERAPSSLRGRTEAVQRAASAANAPLKGLDCFAVARNNALENRNLTRSEAERGEAKPVLTPLPIREAAKRFKSYAEIEATLDLHGLSKIEAYAAVTRFVARERGKGRRHVLIITGKGREGEGILRRELPHWLNEPSLRAHLSAFAHAHPTRGGAGVMHVLLKKHCD